MRIRGLGRSLARLGGALALLALPLACFGVGMPASAAAQQSTGTPRTIGLALSGGSAKGIAHVGVLRALEREGVRVDVVAGTSMGSVVGGMYAMGLSVDSIETVIASADWSALMGDAVSRSRRFLDQRRLDERAMISVPLEDRRVALPSGAIVGSNVVRLLEIVMWDAAFVRRFSDLPRPFVAVATDLETGEAVPLSGGVLSEALRASSGIPGVVEPFELGGRLLVDGAVSRNLPAADARALGADFVICSDVSDPLDSAEELESVIDVLTQVTSLSMLASTVEQRALCDILIRPDVGGISTLDFDRVFEWMARGEDAALAHDRELRELAAAAPVRGPLPRPTPPIGDSVRIARVVVTGATSPHAAELVRRELELQPGDFVDRWQMGGLLDDLDATGLFRLVRYRLDPDPGGAVLTVHVEERPRDRLGVGLRYDDERRAALLFTATLHNLLRYGSVTRFDLRVGEETRVGLDVIRRRGVTGRFGAGVAAAWSQGRLALPPAEGGDVGVDVTQASASVGLQAGRATWLGLEGAWEWSRSRTGAASGVLVSGSAVLDHETLDRIDFPRSGADVTGRLELGVGDLARDGTFTSAVVDGRYFVPLHSRLTVDMGAFIGYSEGPGLPAQRRFFLGGAHRSTVFRDRKPTFAGIETGARSGTVAQVGRVGVRWQVRENAFVRAGVDVGDVGDAWRFPLRKPMAAWAGSVGASTLVGPIVFEVSKAWHGPKARVSVSVGREF